METSILGEKIGFLAKLFGCWHLRMTRPLMDGKIAYQACVNCGARKPFDPKTLRSHGTFYYPRVKKD